MGRDLVFIGAGHAHLTALTQLTRYLRHGSQVTVINPENHHYYSGMGPGMLSGFYRPQEVRFNVKKLTQSRGGTFIKDEVVLVDPDHREITLKSGKTVTYDIASFGIGSKIDSGPIDTSYENVLTAKPISKLFDARCRIMEVAVQTEVPLKILVVGGGAAGVEMANNVWRIGEDLKAQIEITLITKGEILSGFAPRARKKAMKGMRKKGISVIEFMPVKGNNDKKILLENGRELYFDFAIIATGTKPPSLFQHSGIPTGDDGGLLVNQYLQSIRYPELFGGGDCIAFQLKSLDKVGVYAVRQNPILLENLEAALLANPLTSFQPQDIYLLILNMGDGTGIFSRKSFIYSGKSAFHLKNYIDKKFMDEFQLSNELEDCMECD